MAKQPDLPLVKIKPVKYSKNPLKQGAAFVVQGCVFQVYEMKTKGRMLIRFLGELIQGEEVEVPQESEEKESG
jgi:hypothetical protein